MSHILATPRGLTLAGVILAKRDSNGSFAVKGNEKSIHAQLQAAYGKAVHPQAMCYIQRGCELLAKVSDQELEQAAYPFHPNPHAVPTSGNHFSDLTKGLMMFALSGLNDMEDVAEGKERLLKMQRSLQPDALLKSYGLPSWEQLTKDDDSDDDEDDDSDDSDSDNDDDSGDGNSHYNPDEPRIPAGQPGGGQWTTAGNGTSTDSGSISVDDIRTALREDFDNYNPSALPQGTQVADSGQIMTDGTANSSEGKLDIDNATDYLRENAESGPTRNCASYVTDAIRSTDGGGLTDLGYSSDAKNYGPVLEAAGFVPVASATDVNSCNQYPLPGYTPQAGDVVVIQPYPGGNISGHMAMYDGTQWISDFVQIDMWGGKGRRAYAPPYVIYRYPSSN